MYRSQENRLTLPGAGGPAVGTPARLLQRSQRRPTAGAADDLEHLPHPVRLRTALCCPFPDIALVYCGDQLFALLGQLLVAGPQVHIAFSVIEQLIANEVQVGLRVAGEDDLGRWR